MLRLEAGLVLLALLIAFIRPTLGNRWFEKWEQRFSVLSGRRALSVFLVGIGALVLRLAVLPVEPIPDPIVHDEFGYLLAADTFAHGRLTNPTPPMWEHFETFHVMFHPTYASIYPPAQGLILVLGKVIFGHAFWGVWLSCGLMCAAITWMLQGWFAPEWALFGGAISVLRYGVFGYWADSYWGGAVGAIGGALVLGALPRIKESQHIRDALLMGLGLAILANSRPYEGLVLSLPVAVMLASWTFHSRIVSPGSRLTRVVLPLTAALVLAGVATGYYLWRVTGNPFRMPYQIERQNYAVAPYMIWQAVHPEPAYHHAEMRKMFVEEEMLGLKTFRSPTGLLFRAYLAWSFFLGSALTIPFLMLPLTLPPHFSLRNLSYPAKALLVILGISYLGSLLVNFYSPHYSAPLTATIVALVLLSLGGLRSWGRSGRFLSRAVPLVCALVFVLRVMATPLHIPLRKYYEFPWYEENYPDFGRAAIQNELQHTPGKHLVVVRYGTYHEPFAEWVYNKANLESAKIVWARDMGQDKNRELISYYSNRRVWLLQADEVNPKLTPYVSCVGIVSAAGTR